MKRIIVIIFFAIAYASSAQLEFERVWQIHPEGGSATSTRLFFKNDTLLIRTRSTHSGDLETNYFYSTDEGRNWTDLRDEFILGNPVTEKYDFLGELHPLTFEFFNFDRENDSTAFIYIMNLQGEIQKKISYPYLPTQSGIKLNPLDPDYISVHRYKERMFPLEYNHDVGYSTDRGDTWDYMQPEKEIKKQRDITLPTQRKIDYTFSSKNKEKVLYNFLWDNGFGSWYSLRTEFNYKNKEYNFLSNRINQGELLCYECFNSSSLTFFDRENDYFESFDINTFEKSEKQFIDILPFLNSDSLNNEEKQVDITGFWGEGLGFLKSNLINVLHKVLYISIRSDYISEHSNQIDYNNQVFFQSFDNGETWEFIFNNDELYHQVVGMFINHVNNDLWILKDSTVSNRISPSSDSPVLYKSKEPLTSIENLSNSKLNINYQNNNINIISDKYFNNATLNIYNLNGKLLYSNYLDLNKGENTLIFNQQINERLILVQITTNETQIFKLIRSD